MRIATVFVATVVVATTWMVMWATTARAESETGREAARAHYQRGMAQYELDHYELAVVEFEAGFAASPEPAFLYNLALVHEKLGHREEALKFYRKYFDRGAKPTEIENLRLTIARLEQEVEKRPEPAPPEAAAAAPVPSSEPAAGSRVAPSAVVEVKAAPPKKRALWPIAVGVIGGVVVVGVVVGLSVGLTRPGQPVLEWSAR
jgi:hypothetical protein